MSNLREIDRLIAEKVMGWDTEEFKNICIIRAYAEDEVISIPDDFCPSEDIKDAWVVVENLKREGTYLVVCPEKEKYAVNVWVDDGKDRCIPYTSVEADTAPMAICLVALKAVGVEVEVGE
ncbi:BC1872 family protein [Siminovitchia sp. 179-K 8D1 HS]|uniref:BC1872 family protein n=1 Tax=Siminovitchia sp. 179-K 8D1 HS TaxID=3142385 RepID=UPI00399F2613